MSLPPNLHQHVRSYLTGPEVDLQTVSAKQIRKKLATIFPDLDIKALRSEIDDISIPIFHEIKERVEAQAQAKPPSAPLNLPKPLQQDKKPGPSFPPLALPPRGTPGVVVMPQQAGTAVKRPAQEFPAAATRASAKSKKMKSAAYVDGEAEGGASSTAGQTSNKTSAVKKPKASRAPRAPREGGGAGSNKGIHVELNCSPALSELIGVPICSRPQVVKKLWQYIKANGLQKPDDKRQIICDDALKRVFNVNSVNMFTMNKLLADHLYKPHDVVSSPPPAP
ncbi:uncharacterized protein VP01_3214g2 [Puccinia sorghi]|uniref:Uncharacterized protein n=1 Tax=Puccinia sorghi TaxID=27349 RepID=A0A0L6UZ62_9BASI|nr:uncharacterized protein VP01_3214g2 [Puccinia sorghi]